MKIRVVLSRTTVDLLWALSHRNSKWQPFERPLDAGEAVVELDEEVVSHAIDLFDDETFDEAVRRLCHSKLAEHDEGSPQ